MRTQKTVDGKLTTYTYNGDELTYLCSYTGDDTDTAISYEMYFFYDSYGKPSALMYYVHQNGEINAYTYYITTNTFGDVLALYGGDGVVRVKYEYDAWGNVVAVKNADGAKITSATSIAHRNPIRYRGYVYDTDTKFYYLQSRYYNPEIGRFVKNNTGDGSLC